MTHPFVNYGDRAQPGQYPPPSAPISKAPANTNDDGYNPNAADHAAGYTEYQARSAIRDLVSLKGFDDARDHVAMILNDLAGARLT